MVSLGWVARLLGASSKEELAGIEMDVTRPHWSVDGPRTFEELLRALQGWLPDDAVLYFEGGSPDAEIRAFMRRFAVPEQVRVAMGTIWPRPWVFHVPATAEALAELVRIMDHHAEPQLAIHFHVYRQGSVLLQWHDAFSGSMLLGGSLKREEAEAFAGRLGKALQQVV
jgi:hypothetical protein